jgi:hypothetical protein
MAAALSCWLTRALPSKESQGLYCGSVDTASGKTQAEQLLVEQCSQTVAHPVPVGSNTLQKSKSFDLQADAFARRH